MVSTTTPPKRAPITYSSVPDDPRVEYDVTFCSQGTYTVFPPFDSRLTRWEFMLEISRRWKGWGSVFPLT